MKNFYKYSTIVLFLIIIALFIFSMQLRYANEISNKGLETTLKAWSNYIDSMEVKANAYKDTTKTLRQELATKKYK